MAGTWSATRRPKLDLDFADAFASQMMALKRQQLAMQAENERAANKAREMAEAATIKREQDMSDAALEHKRRQEDIKYQRDLANEAAMAEEARKQKADEDALKRFDDAVDRSKILTDAQKEAAKLAKRAGREVYQEPKQANLQHVWTEQGLGAFNPNTGDVEPVMTPNVGMQGPMKPEQLQPPPKEPAPRDPMQDMLTRLNIQEQAREIAKRQVFAGATKEDLDDLTPEQRQLLESKIELRTQEILGQMRIQQGQGAQAMPQQAPSVSAREQLKIEARNGNPKAQAYLTSVGDKW